MATRLAQAFVEISARDTRMRQQMGQTKRTISSNMASMAATARRAMAGVLGSLGVLGGGALFAQALRTMADFDDALVTIRGNLRLLGPEGAEAMAQIEEKARELGATTRFTASQAVDAMNQLALAGFKVDEIMGAIPNVLNLATAANLDIATAASISAEAMKQFGLEASNLDRVNDALLSGQTRSLNTVQTLGEALQGVGSISNQLGVELEFVVGALALMGNQGVRGQQAGTALARMFGALLGDSEPVTEALAELGINMDDFITSSGQLKNVVELMNRLGEATPAQMFAIFGQRGRMINALFAETRNSGKQAGEAIRDMGDAIRSDAGLAAEVAEARMDTLVGKTKEMISAAEALALQVGEVLTPALKDFVDVLTEAVRLLKEFFKASTEQNPRGSLFKIQVTGEGAGTVEVGGTHGREPATFGGPEESGDPARSAENFRRGQELGRMLLDPEHRRNIRERQEAERKAKEASEKRLQAEMVATRAAELRATGAFSEAEARKQAEAEAEAGKLGADGRPGGIPGLLFKTLDAAEREAKNFLKRNFGVDDPSSLVKLRGGTPDLPKDARREAAQELLDKGLLVGPPKRDPNLDRILAELPRAPEDEEPIMRPAFTALEGLAKAIQEEQFEAAKRRLEEDQLEEIKGIRGLEVEELAALKNIERNTKNSGAARAG